VILVVRFDHFLASKGYISEPQTHNVTLAAPVADYVISLGSDGRVLSQGSMSEALEQNSQLRKEIENERALEKEEQKAVLSVEAEDESNIPSGKLIAAEEVVEGHVAWPALKMYFLAVGGGVLWATVFGSCIGASLASVFHPWWLGEWARQYERQTPSEVSAP
jgi:hypothetical protein